EIDVDQPARHRAELDCDVLRVSVELRRIERALLPARANRLLGLAADRDRLPAARIVLKRGSRDAGGPRGGHAVLGGCGLARLVSPAPGLHFDGPLLARPAAVTGTHSCGFGRRWCFLIMLGRRFFLGPCETGAVRREALNFVLVEQHTGADANGAKLAGALEPVDCRFAYLQQRQSLCASK